MTKRKEIVLLTTGFLGVILGLFCVAAFNQHIFMLLPLAARMITAIILYWIIALVPIIIMIVSKAKAVGYGFSKNEIGSQIIIGVLIAVIMSIILTLTPHLLGFGAYVDNGKRYSQVWQFGYEFVYCILAVGFVEELIFRGFIFEKFMKISNKSIIAMIGSSILFGIFHFLGGNIVQIIITTFIGMFFCICRLKIKNCSLLSLIIAHGIYDALITVWASVLL